MIPRLEAIEAKPVLIWNHTRTLFPKQLPIRMVSLSQSSILHGENGGTPELIMRVKDAFSVARRLIDGLTPSKKLHTLVPIQPVFGLC